MESRVFEHWGDFYLLLGTAAAALLALLFVAVSLGVGFLTRERAAATRTFFSPVVIHFAAVFFISAIALVPGHRAAFFAWVIGAAAVLGVAVSGFATVQMMRNRWSEYMEDRFAYGLLPAAAYASPMVAAVMIFAEKESSRDVLAGALLLLMLVNIRNAWDLMLDMVRRHSDPN